MILSASVAVVAGTSISVDLAMEGRSAEAVVKMEVVADTSLSTAFAAVGGHFCFRRSCCGNGETMHFTDEDGSHGIYQLLLLRWLTLPVSTSLWQRRDAVRI